MHKLIIVLGIIVIAGLSTAYSQCTITTSPGCPCLAERYTRGDGWNPNGSINFSAPIGTAGIIACFTPANTQSNIGNNTTYDPSNFALPIMTNCIDPSTGTAIGSLSSPFSGQKILWFNFDLRPFVQWFDFQVSKQNTNIGWALFCSKSPTAGPSNGGISGDCNDMLYHICGTNFTGWAPTPFFNSQFLTPANYYIMVWDTDATPASNDNFSVTFKGRFGCQGDPTYCFIEQSDIQTSCNGNGTYTATVNFGAVNGHYSVVDHTSQAISTSSAPSMLSFTNPSCSHPTATACTEITTAEVSVVYPVGTNYNFTIQENSAAGPISSVFSCDLSVAGIAPSCPVINVTANAIATNVSCFNQCDAIVTATAGNGIAPYTYVWDGGLGAGQGHTGVCAGTYNMVVTDANGSTADAQVIVTQPAAMVASAISTDAANNVTCDGSLSGSSSGGTSPYSYSWDGGLGAGQDFTGTVCVGTYTLTVTDANGCISTSSAIVNGPPVVISVSALGTDATCFGMCNGIVSATNATGGTGPYTYSWDNGLGGGQTHSTACASAYIVTATDANGSFGTATITIMQSPQLNISASGSSITAMGICNGSVFSNASGGTPPYSYTWSGGLGAGQNHSGTVCAGQYTVTVTDGQGCTATDTVTVGGFVDVPTMSEWGLIAFMLVLGSIGLIGLTSLTKSKRTTV